MIGKLSYPTWYLIIVILSHTLHLEYKRCTIEATPWRLIISSSILYHKNQNSSTNMPIKSKLSAIRTHQAVYFGAFQGTLTTRKLENFRGRYPTMKEAETPVFARIFSSFSFEPQKILVRESLSISKRISKKFLEIFLEMHTRLCGSRGYVIGTAVCFSADIAA